MALHNYIYYKQPDPLINTIARPHDARPQVLQYPKQEKQGESEKKPTEKKKLECSCPLTPLFQI